MNPGASVTNHYLNLICYEELGAFIGLLILVGSFRASREPLSDLFSEDLNFGRPLFRATMPRERFKIILRFLRFDDHTTRVERFANDRFAPIRYVFEAINSSFSLAYS